MSFREKYWRYSLFVLIVGLGVTIFVELVPFLGGLLGAATIYVLLRRQMWYLSERRHWRRSVAASLLLAESIVVFLIPISLVVWMLVVKLQDLTLDPQIFVAPLRHVAELIRQRTGYDFWQEDNLQSAIAYLPRAGQWVVKNIADLAINLVVLLFVLYFMLIGGSRMESYVREMLPFNRSTGRKVMREIHMIVRSNAIGIPLLAIVQGIVAYLGYLLFGAPSPLFWGVATCFATIIPIVGTGLVWLPLAAYMALDGRWGAALGLCLYGMLVVTHVDNVVRFVMQKKLADTHPLVTIFGVVIGLSLFGFMGVIFGPLMLAMFIFCVDIFKRHYLEGHGHMAAYSDSSTSPLPPAHSDSPTSSFPPAASVSSTHSASPVSLFPPT
ncbi:MAG: AI-2E family transporter, partial [Alistipes sp.]|nr:AI-2E family transporter [Alistipes sp.]